MKQLINPHAHSHYSLDGAATVEDIILRNKELGAKYVALTEHGNLNSAMELYDKTHKHGVKPILGVELYIQPPLIDELRKIIRQELSNKYTDSVELDKAVEAALKKEYVHLTVHFKDEWAYRYFTKLTPIMEQRAIIKWGERKPIALLEEVAKAAGHITICSSCLVGAVSKMLLPRKNSNISRPDLAEKTYLLLREIAGKDNWFVEIFPHQITHTWEKPKDGGGKFIPHECTPYAPDGDIQKPANQFVLNLAKKYKDPVLISLDSHYATSFQKIVQDARLGNGKEQWKFYNSYHICESHEAFLELQKQLNITEKEFEEWVENSYKFASLFDDFKLTTSKERWVLRPLPENYQDHLIDLILKIGRMNWDDPIMVERLRYEIEVLANNGKINLLSYFFTVNDIVNFCKENDILINVRGSAGGSLLLYVLGASSINPLKHGLSFERFLTLGRIKANTLPDVDMDVSDQAAVMKYLEDKYKDAFCRISVDVGLKLKSSIKDAERAVLGKVRPETEKLCLNLPRAQQGQNEEDFVFGYEEDGIKHKGLVETYKPLMDYINKNPEIWEIVKEMLGINRQKSQHACGVVIADTSVQEYVPITYIGSTKVTGFSPKSLELAGLIKYDILGLNTLRDIQEALKNIKEMKGIVLDPFNLSHDEEVFKRFHVGDTITVFQFDTETVRPYLKQIRPKSIDELAAVTALCRPGTLDAPSGIKDRSGREYSLAELYTLRAKGELPIEYIHPDLESIMKESYGVQLYQEQTLQIFRDIAGYTYEQAENVRRGIGKKDEAVLSACTKDLRDACLKRGWTETQVNLLIEQIMASSRYAFNKSHAISYAYVAYACAYLKYHYPLEWWHAILKNSSKDDLAKYFTHIHSIIDMPSINDSSDKFIIYLNKNNEYRIKAPFTLIDGIGDAAAKELNAKKPFKDYLDFYKKVDPRIINKRIVLKLIMGGVLDDIFPAHWTDIEKVQSYIDWRNSNSTSKIGAPEEILNLNVFDKAKYQRELFTVFRHDWSNQLTNYLDSFFGGNGFIYQKTNNGLPMLYLNWINVEKSKSNKLEPNLFLPIFNEKRLKDLIANPRSTEFFILTYVSEEKEIQYNKTVNDMIDTFLMKKFLVEIGFTTFECIKWPNWGQNHHGITRSLEGELILLHLAYKPSSKGEWGFTIKNVHPLNYFLDFLKKTF